MTTRPVGAVTAHAEIEAIRTVYHAIAALPEMTAKQRALRYVWDMIHSPSREAAASSETPTDA